MFRSFNFFRQAGQKTAPAAKPRALYFFRGVTKVALIGKGPQESP